MLNMTGTPTGLDRLAAAACQLLERELLPVFDEVAELLHRDRRPGPVGQGVRPVCRTGPFVVLHRLTPGGVLRPLADPVPQHPRDAPPGGPVAGLPPRGLRRRPRRPRPRG